MAKVTNKWLANPGGLSRIKEVPTGTINGVNTDFVLSQDPKAAEYLDVQLNGLDERAYTFTPATKTISFTTAPELGQVVTVSYFY